MNKNLVMIASAFLAVLSLMALAGCFGTRSTALSSNANTSEVVPEAHIISEQPAEPEVLFTEEPPTETTTADVFELPGEQLAAPTEDEREPEVTIIGDTVNVRTGPGMAYDVCTKVFGGETYPAVCFTRSIGGTVWYRITYNGCFGYVCSSYATLSGYAPESNFIPENKTSSSETAVADSSNQNTAAPVASVTATAAPPAQTQPTTAVTEPNAAKPEETKPSASKPESSKTAATTTAAKETAPQSPAPEKTAPTETKPSETSGKSTTTKPTESEPSGSWAKGMSGEIISELRAYAAGFGYQWLPSLNANNST